MVLFCKQGFDDLCNIKLIGWFCKKNQLCNFSLLYIVQKLVFIHNVKMANSKTIHMYLRRHLSWSLNESKYNSKMKHFKRTREQGLIGHFSLAPATIYKPGYTPSGLKLIILSHLWNFLTILCTSEHFTLCFELI